jgi:hypothetical protein
MCFYNKLITRHIVFEKPVNWMFGWGNDLYVMS